MPLCKDLKYDCCFRNSMGCRILREAIEPPCRFAKKSPLERPYVLGPPTEKEPEKEFIFKWPYV